MAKVNKKYIEEIEAVLRQVSKDKTFLHIFLTDLLTPAELDEIAVRWQIIKKLANGEAHRDIVDELGVGLATVTRGSRMLVNPSGGFNQAITKGLNKS